MEVVVSGASGLIGKALVKDLTEHGHTPVRLVRRPVRADDERQWDPAAGELDPEVIESADAVVNLSGAGIGDKRWTPSYKQLLVQSRVDSTGLLARTIAGASNKPQVFLSGSAMGIYGDSQDEVLTEETAPGMGFLADLVQQWEAAATPAVDAGVRTAFLRTTTVLTPKGGALRKMLPPFKFGLGGKFGSGRQYWSWITLPDEVKAIRYLLEAEDVAGAAM